MVNRAVNTLQLLYLLIELWGKDSGHNKMKYMLILKFKKPKVKFKIRNNSQKKKRLRKNWSPVSGYDYQGFGMMRGDMSGRGCDEWHKLWDYEDKSMKLNLFISLPKHWFNTAVL